MMNLFTAVFSLKVIGLVILLAFGFEAIQHIQDLGTATLSTSFANAADPTR